MNKKRVLSGMQASGKLHLGNLVGALENWKRMQDEYECFYFIADWHALSTNYEDTGEIASNRLEIAADWLAAGIDPEKSTLFVQSQIPEHAVLHLFLSMIVPVPWLERNPTYKEKIENIKDKDLATYGFLGYPVLQAADISLYKADYVPVGMDQLPHLELTRELVRRFNGIYKCSVLKEPEAKISEVPKLKGTDGRKMSKSYNNAIFLGEEPDSIEKKIKGMVTDTKRARRKDPGEPNDCNLFPLHKIYSFGDEIQQICNGCRSAEMGCTDCKALLLKNLLPAMAPIQEKRRLFVSQPEKIHEILNEGSKRARKVAKATLEEVKEAMKIT
jgi:tryptophanyl-tRNA synthetase